MKRKISILRRNISLCLVVAMVTQDSKPGEINQVTGLGHPETRISNTLLIAYLIGPDRSRGKVTSSLIGYLVIGRILLFEIHHNNLSCYRRIRIHAEFIAF